MEPEQKHKMKTENTQQIRLHLREEKPRDSFKSEILCQTEKKTIEAFEAAGRMEERDLSDRVNWGDLGHKL